MKNFVLACLILVGLASCSQKVGSSVGSTNMPVYGQDFSVKNVMTLEDLAPKVKLGKSVEAQVEGKVEAVCKVKGCWMNIVSENKPGTSPMFVQFHQYSFFMPFDLPGKNVIIKGKAYVEETSVEELRHYAEDEGKSKEEIAKITKPVQELKFMATGVKVKS
jgi:hypothetical protein